MKSDKIPVVLKNIRAFVNIFGAEWGSHIIIYMERKSQRLVASAGRIAGITAQKSLRQQGKRAILESVTLVNGASHQGEWCQPPR